MTHIKFHTDIAWCGAPLGYQFYFRDLDHLIINNRHGERLACPVCLERIIGALCKVPRRAIIDQKSTA